ncbi:hypothetical protein RA8CHR_04481 [Variovorax sp. RA8]|nr:hypothetical protein RA8CHR_04481 [Variovorax sp. RA8]
MKDALEALDWPLARSLLDAVGGPSADTARLTEALRRAGGLLYEYPNPTKEKKRQAFYVELVAYLSSGRPNNVPEDVAVAMETLRVAEAGYRQLVEALSKTDASKLKPAVHVAASMDRAVREAEALNDMLDEQVRGRRSITPHIRVDVGEGGAPLDPDAGLEHIVNFASMTVQMEAFKGGWFDSEGAIVVPLADEPSEEALHQAGSTFLLATLWRRWRSVEQRARLLGGGLRILKQEEFTEGAAPEAKTLVEHKVNPNIELPHWVAAERLLDRLNQNYMEMLSSPSAQKVVSKASQNRNLLPPRGLLSTEELQVLWGVSQALAYDVREDQERPGGLRLVEWIRGYCVLKELAQTTKPSDLVKTMSGWQHFLAGCGFTAGVAERLVKQLTFRRSSRDLFDHPFVKREDGKYLLFKGSFVSMNIATVVFSAIGSLGEQFQKKGKSFERAVRQTFEDAGIPTFSFKANRNGEEFEYDVVVPWGQYLFIFECKNRSLPNNNPFQMHYFDVANRSNVRQVKRLMKALEEYPDILRDNLPADAVYMKRIPVLLNCLPYSVPGGIDGVFFYDYSALSRFFKSGQVFARSVSLGKGSTEVLAGPRLWSGDVPTAEDLIEQLREPLQVKAILDSMEFVESGFPLPPDWAALSSDFRRTENATLAAAIAAVDGKKSGEST